MIAHSPIFLELIMFPNLAGCANCDDDVRRELLRAQIPVTEGHRIVGEVQTSLKGELLKWKFQRQWRYWMATGQMPLLYAISLYNDPIGRTDIRVNGHCAAPEPTKDICRWIAGDGREVMTHKDKEEIEKVSHLFSDQSWKERYIFTDDRELIAKPYITEYHIDTEIGLRVFADFIKSEIRHE